MIIIGASGHGKCVFDVLEDKGAVEAFYDDNPRSEVFIGKPVHLLGDPIPWKGKKDGFIAVGNNADRMNLALRLEEKLNFLTTLHSSVIS